MTARLKHVARLMAGGTPDTSDPTNWADAASMGVPWVAIADMTSQPTILQTDRRVTQSGLASKRLPVGRPGTTLFAMYASVGTVAALGVEAAWNQAILGIQSWGDRADDRFIRYWLGSIRRELVSITRSATQDNLNAEQVANLPFPDLSIDVQRAISDYLDIEVGRLDQLVEIRRRSAALIAERFHALVDDELLRHEGPLVAARRLLIEPPQYGANEPGKPGIEGWPRYIRITDLRADGSLRDDDVVRLSPELAEPYLLADGDVLLARSGATVGKAFLYRASFGSSAFAGYLIRMRPDPARILPTLFFYWTQSSHYWQQLRGTSIQSTIENVNAERYKELLVPVPRRDIQGAIVDRIARAAEAAGTAERAVTGQVALLLERRDALIAAAVAGQIPNLAA